MSVRVRKGIKLGFGPPDVCHTLLDLGVTWMYYLEFYSMPWSVYFRFGCLFCSSFDDGEGMSIWVFTSKQV